jgi:hypothetical protein
VRTVKTASGATAVQIVYSTRRDSRDIEHVGSAHDEQEVEGLKVAARQRLAEDQREFDLGLDAAVGVGPLEITASKMAHLWEALRRAYDVLGFDEAADGDEVFRDLVLARIIEPTSKADSLRVLAEVGVQSVSYATLKRRLPGYAEQSWRGRLGAACATPRWARSRWCSTTCPRSTSKPTRPMGSASRGFPRNADLSRRSSSGYSPTPRGSR